MLHHPGAGINRRSFLRTAGVGLAGVGLGAAGVGVPVLWNRLAHLRPFSGKSVEVAKPVDAMPGPFPGRVVEVHHPESVDMMNNVKRPAVAEMLKRGMCGLTGADDPAAAWRRFFNGDDVVGIKVNPVGMRNKSIPASVPVISRPELVLEVVEGLKLAGVKPSNIILFDRYANEFRNAGYDKLLSERGMEGVRWYASAVSYDDLQLDIEGRSPNGETDEHVVGYDPDQFMHLGFASNYHDPKDDRRFRSHLSVIVTQMVNKIITLPVLKDHGSSGVTLALKNMSHGMNNNVARSHLTHLHQGGAAVGSSAHMTNPNQCNVFIPTAVNQAPLREKATLHILDGLIGTYEGGPQIRRISPTWATWRYQSLFFATDPVAMDHVGWDVIDMKRAIEGWPTVARMGLQNERLAEDLSPRLLALASTNMMDALAQFGTGETAPGRQDHELLNMRQPEHILLAGTIGLGEFAANKIDHRRHEYDPDRAAWRVL
jgi:uncharacterized protein (DUF362 family)